MKGFFTSRPLTGTYLIEETAKSDLEAFLYPTPYYCCLSIEQTLLDLTVFTGTLKWSYVDFICTSIWFKFYGYKMLLLLTFRVFYWLVTTRCYLTDPTVAESINFYVILDLFWITFYIFEKAFLFCCLG